MQLAAGGREKTAAVLAEPAIAQIPQRLHRVGGAAFAQVHLNSLQIPGITKAAGQPVNGEMIQGAKAGQFSAYRQAPALQLAAVVITRRELAAQIGLPAGATEQLLMGGEHLHLTAGMDHSLHAR